MPLPKLPSRKKLNRRASNVVRRGFQTDGVVQGDGLQPSVIVNVTINLPQAIGLNDQPVRWVKDAITREFGREVRSQFQRRDIFPQECLRRSNSVHPHVSQILVIDMLL